MHGPMGIDQLCVRNARMLSYINFILGFINLYYYATLSIVLLGGGGNGACIPELFMRTHPEFPPSGKS